MSALAQFPYPCLYHLYMLAVYSAQLVCDIYIKLVHPSLVLSIFSSRFEFPRRLNKTSTLANVGAFERRFRGCASLVSERR